MTSGGARARSGPPPDPNALRRERDTGEWVDLPASGRPGRAPAWPLEDQTDTEAELWRREWKRPQAVMWEKNGQVLEVALYVRAVAVSVTPDATAADRNVVQRKLTDLGLTVAGLRANRWRIVEDVSDRQNRRAPVQSSAKERLKLVEGGSS